MSASIDLKRHLLRDADAAFERGDRPGCVILIDLLYGLLDGREALDVLAP